MIPLSWFLVACAPAPSAPAATGPDVLLVTLDTVRADRLGAYGYADARTETLDALAARGRRYERAMSPTPLTIPAHATILTGLLPPTHGIRGNGDRALDPSFTTLAERLAERGYATGAVVSSFVTSSLWGLAQGYGHYDDEVGPLVGDYWRAERPADEVVDAALAWLDQPRTQPWHLWVHLYDAHFPYRPPDRYVDPEEPRPYDGEIAFVDDQLGRLLASVDRERTLVVVVGDHGEALGEHGERTHGLFVYDSTQRVPWILAGPGVSPEVVDAPVSLADVVPVVWDALGLPALEAVDGHAEPTSPVLLEAWDLATRLDVAPHVGLVDGPLKLIDLPRPELYDLLEDPHELHDLAADRPADVARLHDLYVARQDPPPAPPTWSADAAARAGLAQLGYTAPTRAPRGRQALPDPKDVPLLVWSEQRSEAAVLEDRPDEAIRILREAVAAHPDSGDMWMRLAAVLGRFGHEEEARAALTDGLSVAPDHPQLQLLNARELAGEERFDESAAAYTRAAEAMPWAPRLRGLAVTALRFAGLLDEARAQGEAWLAAYPEDDHLAGALGVVAMEQQRQDEAVRGLRRGCAAPSPPLEACFWHAALLGAEGHDADAIAALRREIEAHPSHLRAAQALARLGALQRDWDAQRTGAAAAVAAQDRQPEMWQLLTLANFNEGRYVEAAESVWRGLGIDATYPSLVLMDANLLSAIGRREEGKARFDEAREALVQRSDVTREQVGLPEPDAAADQERPSFVQER